MTTIRNARKEEIPALQILNQEAFIDNQLYDADLNMDWALSESGKQYFINLLETPTSCCLVAETNGVLVGYITASEKIFEYRKSTYVEINDLGVSPDYRSKGVGSDLITGCKQWAKKEGYQKIYVNSYATNARAIAFYERNGFTKIDLCLEMTLI